MTQHLNSTQPTARQHLIYLASSWSNEHQPTVLAALREGGYRVYDFRNPAPGCAGFSWSQIDPDWQNWKSAAQIDRALDHPAAIGGFGRDLMALRDCDALVLLRPSGRSAHLEAGLAVGLGKPVFVLTFEQPPRADLMDRLTEGLFDDVGQLLAALCEELT